MRLSYIGVYATLPRWKGGFNSRLPQLFAHRCLPWWMREFKSPWTLFLPLAALRSLDDLLATASVQRARSRKRQHKVVLLGEQPASNPGAVGSNPTDLAQHRTVSREARDPSDTRGNAGSIPAGPTETTLPWPSGNGTSFTRRGSQVRVLPGVLRAEQAPRLNNGLLVQPGTTPGLHPGNRGSTPRRSTHFCATCPPSGARRTGLDLFAPVRHLRDGSRGLCDLTKDGPCSR